MSIRQGGKIISGVYQTIIKEPEPYKRPSDWLPIPAFDSENKDEIYILNGVYRDGVNMLYFKLKGAGTIDWGDGSALQTFNVSSETTYSHHYDYDDVPASSWTEHNNSRQALVHIYGARGAITSFNTSNINYQYTNADGITTTYSDASSDIYEISANVQRSYVKCSDSSGQKHRKLEIFNWKGTITTVSMSTMFHSSHSLQSIPQLDTSSATNMASMFSGCYSLRLIPQLDTSSVTNMSNMFYGCYSLPLIPYLDTASVTDMSSMFYNCYSMQSIPYLDTSSVTYMTGMFYNCWSLQLIPYLDTSSVTYMNNTFYACLSLSLIPHLDTSSVTDINRIFYNCYSLQSIPQLDISNATNTTGMFSGCRLLQHPILYNAGAGTTNSITVSSATSMMMTRQACLDLFNSLHPNNEGYSRTLELGSTIGGRLTGRYVKDSGESVTAIVPTSDTAIIPGKTYYTYNEQTGEYTQVTPDFTTDTFYYELKTASWHRYDFCESTDAGAMLITDYFTNVLKWTVTGV